MMIETATATEMQNNFGRYLSMVMSGQIPSPEFCRKITIWMKLRKKA